MDRLPALIARAAPSLALVLAACGGGPAPGPSRYDAVRAAPAAAKVERWCDAFFPGDSGPELRLPALAPAVPGGRLPHLTAGRWTWINVWATWCVPCRREMPLLARWRAQLVSEGVPFDLWFVSVDDNADELRKFVTASPDVAGSSVAGLGGSAALGGWLKPMLGFAPDSIPVQLIVTPTGRVRCARAAPVGEGDLATVRALLH